MMTIIMILIPQLLCSRLIRNTLILWISLWWESRKMQFLRWTWLWNPKLMSYPLRILSQVMH